jgi:prepilin-type N-terminal cleavage/methylation domain-containing protein
MIQPTFRGFTLSELLVSLAVLGLIAAFAVPKVLNAVGNSSTLAIAKETVSAITTAYDGVKADSQIASVPPSTQAWRLVSKLNYVRTATTRAGTNIGDIGATACTIPTANGTVAASPCHVLMHNGAILSIGLFDDFNDNAAVGASAGTKGKVNFLVDPDGPGDIQPALFALGYDGRLMAGLNAASTATTGTYGYGDNATEAIQVDQSAALGADTIANGNTADNTNSWFKW